ncbi:hypothetical protein NQ318_000365 [Aromia moschata]|uniref:Uncharacterized protein n=1 Tax=Aromia moschata TaxID=1265417 RepID=A0AAV8X8L5_9CUCU|nr:hypothetical protein NQ318_000365 [Aromia moschata]
MLSLDLLNFHPILLDLGKKICGLCTTEPHRILPCQYSNIYMSIFLNGGLAVEVNLFGNREIQT